MPTSLDHVILGINDLDRGIAWVEEHTGVRAVFGGSHPGRGTRNALLALGPDCYLEIIAPDPQQSAPVWFGQIDAMPVPQLIAWAAHTSDITALAQMASSAGLAIDGPSDGTRSRPDGRMLSWKSFRLRDDRGGLLPFFIEWGRNTLHPATDAPAGCRLASFRLQSPDARDLAAICQALTVEVSIEPSESAGMLARLASPKGELELTS